MVKEDLTAFIDNNESHVVSRVNLGISEIAQPIPDGFGHTGRIFSVDPIAPGEACDDCVVVEDPHPELVDHDEARQLLDGLSTAGTFNVGRNFFRMAAAVIRVPMCGSSESRSGHLQVPWLKSLVTVRIWTCGDADMFRYG